MEVCAFISCYHFLESVVHERGRYIAGRPVAFTSLSFIICNCRSPFLMVPYLFMSNLEALFMSWSSDSFHNKWASVHRYWAQILSHLLWPGQFGVWTCKIVKFGKYKSVQKFEGPVRKSDLWYLLNLPVKRCLWFSRLFYERLTFMNWQSPYVTAVLFFCIRISFAYTAEKQTNTILCYFPENQSPLS